MRVKLLVSRASLAGGEQAGQVIDVSQAEAIRMIEAGQAEPVREGRKPERATRKRNTENT